MNNSLDRKRSLSTTGAAKAWHAPAGPRIPSLQAAMATAPRASGGIRAGARQQPRSLATYESYPNDESPSTRLRVEGLRSGAPAAWLWRGWPVRAGRGDALLGLDLLADLPASADGDGGGGAALLGGTLEASTGGERRGVPAVRRLLLGAAGRGASGEDRQEQKSADEAHRAHGTGPPSGLNCFAVLCSFRRKWLRYAGVSAGYAMP